MIRRGFWLTAGALAGVYGYRRACAVGRRITKGRATEGRATKGRTTKGRITEGRTAKGRISTVGLAAETVRFARDVRDGMDLYMARHSAPAGSTLGARETNRDEQPEDGR